MRSNLTVKAPGDANNMALLSFWFTLNILIAVLYPIGKYLLKFSEIQFLSLLLTLNRYLYIGILQQGSAYSKSIIERLESISHFFLVFSFFGDFEQFAGLNCHICSCCFYWRYFITPFLFLILILLFYFISSLL